MLACVFLSSSLQCPVSPSLLLSLFRCLQTFADQFLLLEYGSDLGGISTSIAAAYPRAVIVSVDEGLSTLDDGSVRKQNSTLHI